MVRAYIGTYTKATSEGIYLVELSEEGKVLEVRNVAKVDNPTYLALSNDNKYLYSVSRVDGKGAVTSFKVEENGDLKELTWVFARIIFFLHELIPGYSCIWWRNMRK